MLSSRSRIVHGISLFLMLLCVSSAASRATATTIFTAQREACTKAKNVATAVEKAQRCVVDQNVDVSTKNPPQATYPDPNGGAIEGTPASYATIFESTIGYDESDGSGRAELAVDGSFEGIVEAGWVLEMEARYTFGFDTDQADIYVFRALHDAPGIIATLSLFDGSGALVEERLLEHIAGDTAQMMIPAPGVYTFDIALGLQTTDEAPLGNSSFATDPIGVIWAPIPEPASLTIVALGVLALRPRHPNARPLHGREPRSKTVGF